MLYLHAQMSVGDGIIDFFSCALSDIFQILYNAFI